MKYLIWQNNNDQNNKGNLLNVLLTNRSFAEIFEGDNPIHPLGGIIKIHQKKYKITKFEKIDDDMVEIVVALVTEGVSEVA